MNICYTLCQNFLTNNAILMSFEILNVLTQYGKVGFMPGRALLNHLAMDQLLNRLLYYDTLFVNSPGFCLGLQNINFCLTPPPI